MFLAVVPCTDDGPGADPGLEWLGALRWSGCASHAVFSGQRCVYVDAVQRTKVTDFERTFWLEDLGSLMGNGGYNYASAVHMT